MTSALPGVVFAEPPPDRIGPIMRAVEQAASQLTPGQRVALVSIFNERGANAAIVVRAGVHVTVHAWIGKTWDGPHEYGAVLKAAW